MRCFFVSVMAGLAMNGSARAQELDARALADLIAPHVNETTQVIGHVDVPKVDLKGYFQTMSKFLGVFGGNKEMAAARDFALAQQEKLVKSGIRHVLAVVNLGDISGQTPPEIVVIAPLGKNAHVDDLLKMIQLVPGFTAKVDHNQLVARFGGMNAVPAAKRPEFTAGLEHLKGKTIQIVASPTPKLRRFVEQQMPKLPPQLGGEDITLLTKGIRWIGIGYGTSLFTTQYVIQAKDVQTAKDLKGMVDKGLESLSNIPDLADLGKVRELLDLRQQDDRLTLTLNEATVNALLVPAVAKVRQAAARTQSMNNLKQIGLAMHVSYDVQKALPTRAIFDKNGKPLLSWRVHILPYIEEQQLYQQFKLDEPWDSPNNKKLIGRMPQIYLSPLSKLDKDGKTTYLAITGKGSMFDGTKGIRFADVTDGTSNTIMVVEANDKKAVTWTQPEDFPIDTKEPLASLVIPEVKGFMAVFADGSVHFLSASIRPATLQALFTRNGGEPIDEDF